MPIYQLTDDVIFPPIQGAEDGIVAVGGDLLPERLLLAYKSGIFPWFNEGDPVVWWSPDPRCVIFPEQLHVSRSMQRVLSKGEFSVTFNKDFEGVIAQCKKTPREGQDGTWITDEMQLAYIRLHDMGHAQSVEVWRNSQLVGGMYGVHLGTIFCGESMFSLESNASKVALVTFMKSFQAQGGALFDCQVTSPHLLSMGAVEISRKEFAKYLEDNQ